MITSPLIALALTLTPLQERVEHRKMQRLGQAEQIQSPRRFVRTKQGTVVRVVDGSAIVVRMENGQYWQVRTLGAEAPLIDTGSSKQQCFALEAKQKLSDLILQRNITLERDKNYQKDNNQRYLRYVRLGTLDVNGYMLDSGYAFADDKNAHARSADYDEREAEARKYDRGLWGDYCTYKPNPRRVFEVLQ